MDKKDMELIEHLEELRKRLIITLSAFVLLLIGSLFSAPAIYRWLAEDLPVKLAVLGPSDILWIYFILAGVIALAGTIPVAAHQAWLFVRPALHEHERKITLAYIPALFLLFVLGVCFGYFIIFPFIFKFLLSLSGDAFTTLFTAEKYFRFVIHTTVPFGFLFELPVVIMFLTSLGVLNPHRLQRARKFAYFLLILAAVFITPPDLLSDVLVIIPLLFLYECSVGLSKFVYRRKHRMNDGWAKNEARSVP
ncbi:twin-arginine translocase subunit TatC [Geobacillus stearothermophilus]|jgi:sec-independent protein translocase protein TatC|uniref:twin-arginine translocase subunit TatC n=1 Tax=Geobacillus stearothermophilus TaxID=1422 RepID=UPI000501E55B|nr:preprotein translocase subunit TatC [Geobacillus sp. LC300]KFL16593.1 preprotein translocase subunit TatC [Geobacillus stearothermophilus]KFX33130.1 preprotein translocase subunit TatC [Geobacillus stearothermophilus]KZM56173.1 preprotein translocase subunit TatC [Geobacillus stearothermophilus]WJQ07681.1 twin-arginine translocase subunit TatC [Geobacillus stearothermophilus]